MECPYCGAGIERLGGRCPSCKRKLYEVTEADFEEEPAAAEDGERLAAGDAHGMSELIVALENRFVCARCGHQDGSAREVAMTGPGFSKLLDVQHNHYLFVSCQRCGHVEVFDPAILLGKRPGGLGTLLDLLF